MTIETSKTPEKAAPLRRLLKSIADIAVIVVLITIAKTAIAEPYYVPSGSMEPTLLIGDELLATKYPYGYSSASIPFGIAWPQTQRILGSLPARGDVVVFRWPGDRSQVWVKRVIGLPGDRVQMKAGRLWLNGTEVETRPAGVGESETEDGTVARAARYVEMLPDGRAHEIFKLTDRGSLDNTPEVVVPVGNVFVMGDNRDNSADSRVPLSFGGVGLLPVSDLIGRVETVIGSWDLATRRQPLWEWPSGLRLSRFFTAVR